MRQPFPTTAADLITALGATGVILPANVLAIYQCDTASPLVDSLGLGPNLVAAGGPLTGRECVGLPDVSFTSKVGVETIGGVANGFAAGAGSTFMHVDLPNVRSALLVTRVGTTVGANQHLMNTWFGSAGTRSWDLFISGANLNLRAWNNGGVATILASVAFPTDSSWHSIALNLRGDTRTGDLFSDVGDAVGAAPWVAGESLDLGRFTIGDLYGWLAQQQQAAYLACFDLALTSAMRATFWRAFQSAGLGTPNTYMRATPYVVPISASRVACYSAGQFAVGYNAGLASAALGNALGTGTVHEDGAVFQPIGSDSFYGNLTPNAGTTKASVDGPSGMRDGARVTIGGAWGVGTSAYLPLVSIVGASNIPWRFDANYRRATNGTTSRAGLYFAGSAGGTETFTLISDGATPVDWIRSGGTCTPVNADQTQVFTIFGAALNGNDCDFSEPAVIRSRTTPSLAWRRVDTAASANINVPALWMTNVDNSRYNPSRGSKRISIANFQLSNGATFFSFGAAAAAGAMVLDYDAGQLRLRVWDSAAVLAATVLCGPLTNTRWDLLISWDARNPLPGIGGAYVTVERINPGASPTLLGTWLGPWTPQVAAAVTPLYIGTNSVGGGSARCLIELG